MPVYAVSAGFVEFFHDRIDGWTITMPSFTFALFEAETRGKARRAANLEWDVEYTQRMFIRELPHFDLVAREYARQQNEDWELQAETPLPLGIVEENDAYTLACEFFGVPEAA